MKRVTLAACKSRGSKNKARSEETGNLPATQNPGTPVSSDQVPRPPRRISRQALGAKDEDFFHGLMRQMLTYTSGEVDDDIALKMMISFIEDVKPKDQVHAALALQRPCITM
jgi:hypothetical protein